MRTLRTFLFVIAVLILVPLAFTQNQPVQHVLPSSPGSTMPSSSQNWPSMVEIFGGYSYVNVDMNGLVPRQNVSGWEASVSSRVYKRMAVVGEVSGYYKEVNANELVDGFSVVAHLGVRDYAYAGGPRINLFKGVFVHALVGADRLSGDLSANVLGTTFHEPLGSQTSFLFVPGGGAQIKVTRNLSFRTTADYVITRHNIFDSGDRVSQYNLRVSVGPVFTFGGTAPRTAVFPAPVTSHSRSAMAIPALGVLTSTREGNDGTEIVQIAPGSVAELGGLHVTDVINAVDGRAVTTPMELAAALSDKAPGSKVRLGYMFQSFSSTDSYNYSKETVVILGQIH